MTPEQIQLVRLTLAQATNDPVSLGQQFYRRLFILAPDLRVRFDGDIDAESLKLKDALTLAFGALSDMPFLVATLEVMAQRGVVRGLSEKHCRAIAQSLLWAVERRVGTAAFTPQVCNAWIALLAVVVSILRPTIAIQRSHAA
jgi:hemoglobin-like flavoprotein